MQLIELSGDESITVIRSLLEQATDSQVLLFVPKGCEALERNEVNLAVLRRWADNLALRVGLVIEDRETRGLATRLGFVVLRSIEAGARTNLAALDRHRRRRGLPPRPAAGAVSAPAHTAVRTAASMARQSSRTRRLYLAIALTSACLLAVAFGSLYVLPSATVTLRPVTEPLDASMAMASVAGLTEINYGAAQIPARTVSVEQTGADTSATTNRRDVPDGHAQGTVIFANKTTIPVTITKGTVVRTSFGENVRFFTVADVWLPGELHGTVRVGVLAAEPGPPGNVPALTINVLEGELAAQASVLNDSRTTGGTVRRISTVGAQDKVDLRAKLMKSLQEQAYAQLTAALASGEFVAPESLVITVLQEAFDHDVDGVTDSLGMTMTVQVDGLAAGGADAQKLLLGLLDQRIKPGYRLLPDSARFERGSVLSAGPDEVRFNMTVRAQAVPVIDVDALRRAIAGKTVDVAAEYLSRQFNLTEEPQIELRASLTQRLPWWPTRIRMRTAVD